MKTAAYVDTSCLVAIALDEPGAKEMSKHLARFDQLVSSNLLEAELRAALARNQIGASPDEILSWITWVFPDRPLTREISRVLEAGYLRGPDLWHVASALYLVEEAKELPFVTLDSRQRAVAEALGFPE